MLHDISSYDYKAGLPDNYTKFIPLGNGHIGASVWTSKKDKSEITLLLSATDSFSELGRILKLCKATITIEPNIFEGNTTSHLVLDEATLYISSKKANIKIYTDSSNDVLCFSINSDIPVNVLYSVDNYRKNPVSSYDLEKDFSNYAINGTARFHEISESSDIITLSDDKKGIIQYHRNTQSCTEYAFYAQNLTDKSVMNDPYINRTFGTYVVSEKMQAYIKDGVPFLETASMEKKVDIQVWSLVEVCDSKQNWINKITSCSKGYDMNESYSNHKKQWQEYWKRYYIYAYGDDNAKLLTRAWIYQKYFNRCAGKGNVPIKFNGSIFVTYPFETDSGLITWDYRRWGGAYWIQNTRHIYWNMLLSGDFEGMKPLYDMLTNLIPISKHRCHQYYSHDGILLPETFTIGGLYCASNYGIPQEDGKRYAKGTWLHQPGQIANHYIRWHYNGMLELAYLILLGAKFADDEKYKDIAYNFSREVLTFFYEHFDTLDGKILMKPVSSLETYQDCVNDLPDIAGLDALTNELLAQEDIYEELKIICEKIRDVLVDYPKDDNKLMPCQNKIDIKRRNSENPELYSIFPFYRHTLINKEDELFSFAVNAFNERSEKAGLGWSQDCIQSALLGLVDQTEQILIKQALNTDERYSFSGIYGPNYDETPDQDHANGLSIGLIHSLVLSTREKNMLFLAWPEKWNVSFKLPLYSSKSVSVIYEDGKIKHIEFEDKLDEIKTVINL